MTKRRIKTLPLLLLAAALVILVCCSGPTQNAASPDTQSPAPVDSQSTPDDTESVPNNAESAPVDTDAPPDADAEPVAQAQAVLMPDPIDVVSEEAEHCPVFGSDYTRGQIAAITVLSDPSKAPEGAWDVSEAGDRSVMAWTLKTRPPFDLYLAAEGGIVAPSDCSGMFCGYSNLERVRFEAPFDTSRAVDMSSLFDSCGNLTELDVSGFDTSNVTDMQSMFRNCGKLETLDVSGFHTSNVTDMRSMFRNCSALKELDISGFDMSNVTDVRWMFAECTGLKRFARNDFDFSSVELRDGYMKNVPICFSATPLTGTPGFDDERNYTMLFDGNPDTKWCLILNNVAYVEWKMSGPGSVAHLSLTSGDNHDEYPGRNPGSWRLLGTDRERRQDGVWTVLGEMSPAGFEEHDDKNYVTHTTTFNGDAPAFEYYRLEILSTTGAQILQLSEINMDYQ